MPKDAQKTASSYGSALAVSFFSGAAALAYELLWTRRLIDLVGATTEASSRVFGIFVLGLAVGSIIAGSMTGKIRRYWLAVALVQFGTALLSVPMLTITHWSSALWHALGTAGLVRWGGTIKLGLSVAIIMPPSITMGMALPFLVKASLGGGMLRDRGVALYAVNTVGAVAGILGITLYALERFGVNGAFACVMILNGCVGAFCLVQHLQKKRADAACAGGQKKQTIAENKSDPIKGSAAVSYCIAFVSGMFFLAAEILCLHLIRQIVQVSLYPEAAVLCCFVAVLSLSAWVVPRVYRLTGGKGAAGFSLLFVISGIAALIVPLLFTVFSNGMTPMFFAASTFRYLIKVLGLTFATMGGFVFVAGLLFPMTFRYFEESRGASAKNEWGWLLAANGLGGLVGTVLANSVLMPLLGMNRGLGFVGFLYIAAGTAGLFFIKDLKASRLKRNCYSIIAAVALIIALGPFSSLPLLYEAYWNEGDKRVTESSCGPEGVVSIVRRKRGNVLVMNSRYFLGGSVAPSQEERMAVLPLLLHPAPRSVATLGVGTGITAGTFLRDRRVESLDAVEISGLVIQKAHEYFGTANHGLFSDRRSKVIREDARIFTAASSGRYDILLGELYLPWGSGEGRMYSVEHFAATWEALRSGGVFCQWLPLHMLTREDFRVIVTSFAHIYGKAWLFRYSDQADPAWLAVVGFKDAELSWKTVSDRVGLLTEDTASTHLKIPVENSLRANMIGMIEDEPGQKPVVMNTLDNAWVEIHASKIQMTVQNYIGTPITADDIARVFSAK